MALRERLSRWLGKGGVPDEFWEDWEAALIEVDLGAGAAGEVIGEARRELAREGTSTPEAARQKLEEVLARKLSGRSRPLPSGREGEGPVVIMVIGVNGTGKTTTIAKLAHRLKGDGRKVLLAACDTYRAAAIEQLRVWADRLGVELIEQEYGGDPAAIAYDALQAASSRGCDYLIIDTAGRLHTSSGLMAELEKMVRALRKIQPEGPQEIYLVLDASVGQNGLSQAEKFAETLPLTGVVLTKVDGTARGGIVLPIRERLGLPVVALGVGEEVGDLIEFDPAEFVRALLGD